MKNDPSIDAVVTWVDGSDFEHRRKRELALSHGSVVRPNRLVTGADTTRFVDNGELRYCLAAIRKFAPWIRTIHLVTDNQCPDFLTTQMQSDQNIRLVNHEEIFDSYEWALPTFNSRSIESALWRIPGLAPRFIYFNDDFILTRPVEPDDFFREGKVVLRGRWNSIKRYGSAHRKLNDWASLVVRKMLGITRSMHLLLQIRSAQRAGFDRRYFRIPHVPHPLHTETIKRYFEANKECFENNIKFRFRNTDQISSIFLANHLEIRKGRALLRDASDAMMINGEMVLPFTLDRQFRKIRQQQVRFVCLQAYERFKPAQREKINRLFDNLLEPDVTEPVGELL